MVEIARLLLICSVNDCVTVWFTARQLSCTVIEGVNVPLVEGVPEIKPELLIDNPVGRPVADHASGVNPPEAVICTL